MIRLCRLKNTFLSLLIAFLAISCIDDDDIPDRPDASISDLAGSTGDLSILVAALERADLLDDLDGIGRFTVLAPTNAAFALYLDVNDYADINAVPVDVLRQLLLNHVIAGEFRGTQMVNQVGYLQTSASGPVDDTSLSLLVNGNNGFVFNNMAQVTQGGLDIIASNGTIHIVDAVVDLPTLPTLVLGNPIFSDLATGLTTATPSADYVSVLSESGLYTLFGPSDNAFDRLFSSNPNWSTVEDIDEETLIAVLNHHVIGGANILLSDIENGQESPATLEGDILVFTPGGANSIRVEDGSGNNNALITAGNIQASNGVLHLIDRVLIPDTEN